MTKGLGIGLLFGVVAISACASTTTYSRQRQTDRAFECIQVHEAHIERSRVAVTRSDLPCKDICAAASDAQTHQLRLCNIAGETADADALARCERAQRTASAIQAQAVRHCGCARQDR